MCGLEGDLFYFFLFCDCVNDDIDDAEESRILSDIESIVDYSEDCDIGAETKSILKVGD